LAQDVWTFKPPEKQVDKAEPEDLDRAAVVRIRRARWVEAAIAAKREVPEVRVRVVHASPAQ